MARFTIVHSKTEVKFPLLSLLLQWNPIHTVSNGPKNFGHING